MILDVVYNHFGASGNYAQHYAPYFKPGRNTWGDLVNLEAEPVRRFIIDNALMWLRDYHADGLRLDAVHALVDTSTPHILAELQNEVDALRAEVGRPLTLIAESDLNDPVMITDRAAGGYGLDAQWDDDVHHALHATLTGETQGYYCDFGPLHVLAKVLTSAFFHDGTYSTFRGSKHGKPVDRSTTPGYRFVVCLQNHDQVGNRAVGDRLPELTTPARLRIGAVLLMTSPFTPMLWMGEEWAASTRWPFFTSHPEPELAAAIGPGRLKEFDGHGWDTSQMIDPQDPEAYREAILNWDEVPTGAHAPMLAFYRQLIELRHVEPGAFATRRLDRVVVDFDDDALWLVDASGRAAGRRQPLRRDPTVSLCSHGRSSGDGRREAGRRHDAAAARAPRSFAWSDAHALMIRGPRSVGGRPNARLAAFDRGPAEGQIADRADARAHPERKGAPDRQGPLPGAEVGQESPQ